MKCPKCKTEELKKRNPHSPYCCEVCGGMWLVEMETPGFAEMVDEPSVETRTPDDHDEKTGLCPSGHGIMIRAKVDIDKPFFLEKCTACGGIWFDKGEWDRIAEHNLAESLGMIWSKSWQRKQSQAKNREHFLETNRKLLGPEVFQSIVDLSERLKGHPEKDRAIALLVQEIG